VDDVVSGETEVLIYQFAPGEELVLVRVRDFFGNVGDFVMSAMEQ